MKRFQLIKLQKLVYSVINKNIKTFTFCYYGLGKEKKPKMRKQETLNYGNK